MPTNSGEGKRISLEIEGNAHSEKKRICVKNAFVVNTLFPDTLHIDENGGRWSVGGVDFELTYDAHDNIIENIKLTRSDAKNLPAAEEDKIKLHRSGNILTAVGGYVQDNILPDSITELDNGDYEMIYGEQRLVFSAKDTTDTDGCIHDIGLSVDGYTSMYDDDAVRLVPFRDMLICDNGDITDGHLPDKIETISDTEVHFTYGDEVFSLTWEKTNKGIKNSKYTKI